MFLKSLGKMQFEAAGPLESGFSVHYNVKDIQLVSNGKDQNIISQSITQAFVASKSMHW
ncbi:MAG: hypothetical protein SH818_04250 [Saprospiraceae bacterium]|nr:hypothetical protein [Saprospiraceae bacterium]